MRSRTGGVADQDVEFAEFADRLAHGATSAARVGKIGLDGMDAPAELGRQRRRAIGRAVVMNGDVGAGVREGARDRSAHAVAAGARHQRSAAE